MIHFYIYFILRVYKVLMGKFSSQHEFLIDEYFEYKQWVLSTWKFDDNE